MHIHVYSLTMVWLLATHSHLLGFRTCHMLLPSVTWWN